MRGSPTSPAALEERIALVVALVVVVYVLARLGFP